MRQKPHPWPWPTSERFSGSFLEEAGYFPERAGYGGDNTEGGKENIPFRKCELSKRWLCKRLSRRRVAVPSPAAQPSLPAASQGKGVTIRPLFHDRDASAQCSLEQDVICARGRVLTDVGLTGVTDTHHNWQGSGV